MSRITLAGLAVVLWTAFVVSPGECASRYDPALRFRTLATQHFLIHYHQGEDALALRLSLIVESEHAALTALFGYAPRARTHVILVDQNDSPNGWSSPLPYNTIELTAAPPSGAEAIGNTDDWLRMVFRHEYTHTLHLDRARGWASAARHVFGRAVFAFPNLTTPEWQIEGLATFVESTATSGRVPAGDFRSILTQAAGANALQPLDRVNGYVATWPGPEGWYAYGAYFYEYLATHFGTDRIVELAHQTSGRAPYLTSGSFQRVFGKSLGQLWRDFEGSVATASAGPPGDAAPRRLTSFGYNTGGTRFDGPGTVLFTRRDPHDFPTLSRIDLDTGAIEPLMPRLGGNQVSATPAAIYVDKLEYIASTGLVSDLYRLDRGSGRVVRLTRGGRLSDPDVSPDGRRIAAVTTRNGRRALIVLDRERLERSHLVFDSTLSMFQAASMVVANPRWSPDGESIAVERRNLGGRSEIAIVNARTGDATAVATSSRGRNVTPAWTPDGKAIVFASDRDGGPFDLYRVTLDATSRAPGRLERLTELPGGAWSPDISPDGTRVAFVSRGGTGDDVYTMPLVAHAAAVAEDPAASPAVARQAAQSARAPGSAPYTPWSTIWPRSWLPVLESSDDEVRLGVAAGGADVLGYHAWAATATWSVARRAELDPVSPAARPDFSVAYAYDRWRPTLFAQVDDETTPRFVPAAPDRPAEALALREQSLEAGSMVVTRHVRSAWQGIASYRFEHDSLTNGAETRIFDRGALRAGVAFDSREQYGFSISPERGVLAGAGVEIASAALGGDGEATFVRADARAYAGVVPRHAVLAVRATAAASNGDRSTRRVLFLGGADTDGGVVSYDEDASSLLRGFPANAFVGDRVALANVEYRLPLFWVERGHGTWPLLLRSVHATAFADVGHAWVGRARLSDVKSSWGGELSADVVAGFVLPVTLTGGVAWGHDGEGLYPDQRQFYVRLGYGF